MGRLEAMRAFVEIVDQGSLTAAADALDRSLPTMVRTLALLEKDLGACLLARTTRRMSLTEEGRAYLERCRGILSDVDEAEQALAAVHAEPRGEIRVTAPVLFGQLHVAPPVTKFLERHHAVRVELVLLDRVVNIVEEGFDVAVRIGRPPDSSLIATVVGEERRVVCASPALLDRVGPPDEPGALADLPCVAFRGLSPSATWHFTDGGRDRRVVVRSPFGCNHAVTSVEACVAGLGFGRFLSYQVERFVQSGELAVVLEDFEGPRLPVNLMYPEARLMSSRVRVFLDAMKKSLRSRRPLGR